MRETTDKWMGQLCKQLEDYSVDLPPESWNHMEKRLKNNAFKIRLRRWSIAACLVLLLGLSAFLFPFGEATFGEATPKEPLATVTRIAPEEPVPAQMPIEEAGDELTPAPAQTPAPAPEASPTHITQTTVTQTETTPQKTTPQETEQAKDTPQKPSRTLPHYNDELQQEPIREKTGKWMLAANSSVSQGIHGNLLMKAAPSASANDIQSDVNYSDPGSHPYSDYDYDHHIPVSFGITANYCFSSHLWVESGVFATWMRSEIKPFLEGGPMMGRRELWYIGIPLQLGWTFFSQPAYDFYLSGGGAVQKCISASFSETKNPIDLQAKDIPLQWSLSLKLGGQAYLLPSLSLYLEPALTCYLNDGSSLKSIRKDRPVTLDVQAGLRFHF